MQELTNKDTILSGILCLHGYNNYFNRVHRKIFATTEELIDHLDSLYESDESDSYVWWESFDAVNNVNFNPNDGINTEIILGREQLYSSSRPSDNQYLDWDSGERTGNFPDYLIVYKRVAVSNDTSVNEIQSRWFVLNCERTRLGQYKLTLKRDTISDYVDFDHQNYNVNSLPAYINKGYVGETNQLVLNNEGCQLNQIKTDEILLSDKTNSAWIVGYVAKDAGLDGTVSVQIADKPIQNFTTVEDIATDLGVSSTVIGNVLLPDEPNNFSWFVNNNVEIDGWVNYVDNTNKEYIVTATSTNNLGSFTIPETKVGYNNNTSICFCKTNRKQSPRSMNWLESLNYYLSIIKSNWDQYTDHPLLTRRDYDYLHNLVESNAIIYRNGVYYKVREKNKVLQNGTKYEVSKFTAPFENVCSKYITDFNAYAAANNIPLRLTALAEGTIYVYVNEIKACFYLEKVSDTDLVPGMEYEMSTTRNACQDQVYDMFAIPYNTITARNGSTQYIFLAGKAQAIAVELAKKLDAKLYDIQLLPYLPNAFGDGIDISTDGGINLTPLEPISPGDASGEGYDYDYITLSEATVTQTVTWSIFRLHLTPGIKTTSLDDSGIDWANFFPGVDNATVTNVSYEVLSGEILSGEPLTLTTSNSTRTLMDLDSGTTTTITGVEVDSNNFTWEYDGTPESIPQIAITIEFTAADYPGSIVLYPRKASFKTTINQSLELKDSMKIEANCNNYRLCSPNYQGSFDFNVAKNGGQVNKFYAECTYKPYTPYIKVVPELGGIYGANFGDARGLICGGDFSIGRISDAWESYELNNKNYQNIFNREIQNLEVAQNIQREQYNLKEGLAVAAGAFAGATKGASYGGKAGGGYGAVAGAILGGVGGAAVPYALGEMNRNWMERQLVEQKQFAIDKYNLQLGNIQALPYTLTKVGAFDINSKIFPFLEYYTCTDVEKEALENKIHYEGMTVGIVGNVFNYIDMINGSYIQAELIKGQQLQLVTYDDANYYENIGLTVNEAVMNDIYTEFKKGIFWYGEEDMDKYKLEEPEEPEEEEEGE